MKKIDEGRTTLKSYTSGIWEMFQDSQVLTIMLSNTLIKMGQLSILAFFPIYIKESLGYSAFELGVYLALLYLMGVVSQPVMGILSDKIGRKSILVPSFAITGILYAGIAMVPAGVLLMLVVSMLGMFFYPILNMTQTAIMDVAPKQVQASTMGVMGLLSQPLILGSPILAGYLVTNYGIESAFWYAAITAVAASVVLLPIRFRRTI
jgi:predicted MFS family arabinose efflux permease